MLPITARKKLRVPHHIAMACAAIAVLVSLFMDVNDDAMTTAMSAQATEAKSTQQTRQQSPELRLPRLLPWRHWPESL